MVWYPMVWYPMTNAKQIREACEEIERRYHPGDPPEHLSMAASCAMLVEDRTGDATRADIRDNLRDLEPDENLTDDEIWTLRRMAR